MEIYGGVAELANRSEAKLVNIVFLCWVFLGHLESHDTEVYSRKGGMTLVIGS